MKLETLQMGVKLNMKYDGKVMGLVLYCKNVSGNIYDGDLSNDVNRLFNM